MNIPSVKTLERAFPGKGKILRRLLASAAAVREHPAAVALAAQCYNPPTLGHMRLYALDREAGTYGVEAVYTARKPDGETINGVYGCPAFEYLNTGDVYAATIVRAANGRYRVTDIGSIIERGNYA